MKTNRTDTTTERAALTFAALGSEARLAVLQTLVRAGPEGLGIGLLGNRCGITGSTLTFHLNTLAQAGLITRRKHGRQITCAADTGAIRALSEFLLAECCADRPGSAPPVTHGSTDG
ncbi:MAG: helix-turn-helix transcriptional regulator [Pararhodobacter sp.]|nr:helix-turn-helix transcriptional regulator [Pararhodobacter sp.]